MQAAVRTLRAVPKPPGELENLFRAHHDRVFRTAHRITGSAADAEDVLQTIFLRLATRRENYDLSENPGAYLSRAAVNASLDLMRSRTRAKSVGLEDANVGLFAEVIQGHEARVASAAG